MDEVERDIAKTEVESLRNVQLLSPMATAGSIDICGTDNGVIHRNVFAKRLDDMLALKFRATVIIELWVEVRGHVFSEDARRALRAT